MELEPVSLVTMKGRLRWAGHGHAELKYKNSRLGETQLRLMERINTFNTWAV